MIFLKTNLREQLLHVMNTYLEAKNEPLTEHPLGSFIRTEIPSSIEKLPFITDDYSVTGSVGRGNWAYVPWIAILHKKVTNSTQRGFYIVFLFSENMDSVYLTIAQGVTKTAKEEMQKINQEIRMMIDMKPKFQKDSNITLGSSRLARDYSRSTAVYVKYERDKMPSEDEIIQDLKDLIGYYEEYIRLKSKPLITKVHQEQKKMDSQLSEKDLLQHITNYIRSKGFYYKEDDVKNFYLSLKTKPFVILSGISGTGKTKMVQLFAESIGATVENGRFQFISVRPDWSDSSDLLGYKNLEGEFVAGPLTKLLKKANQKDNRDKPFFVLLDEMNLARVEYYFSDLLSIMETKKFDKDGNIISDPVIDQDEEKLILPDNVYIVGTVNMDETTHSFSKKVLDRANTIEYNDIYFDYFNFFEEESDIQPIPIHNKQLAGKYLSLKDAYFGNEQIIKNTTQQLIRINRYLEEINAQFAYRVRDEICFYMIYNEQAHLLDRNTAFDYQIMQKILPRVSGNDSMTDNALKNLFTFCTGHYWSDEIDITKIISEARYPKSAKKIAQMIKKNQSEGFTAFW